MNNIKTQEVEPEFDYAERVAAPGGSTRIQSTQNNVCKDPN
jgi:hypothetical protein